MYSESDIIPNTYSFIPLCLPSKKKKKKEPRKLHFVRRFGEFCSFRLSTDYTSCIDTLNKHMVFTTKQEHPPIYLAKDLAA